MQKEFAAERKALCNYIREDSLLGKFFKPFLFEELPAIDLIDKCREKGLKTPEFHFDEDGQVIIWRKNVTPNVTPVDAEIQSVDKGDAQNVTPDVTPDKVALRVKNILTELMSNRYITTDELAAKFKVSSRTITRNINSLRETYTIIWIPLSNTKGYWKVGRK